jgi:hypothetical protein
VARCVIVVQGCEVFLELEGRVELLCEAPGQSFSPPSARLGFMGEAEFLTSCNGTRGGPAAMSADFVPGWMRRLAFVSMVVCSIWAAWRAALGPIRGDLGPIWISAGGGGLGSRGELGGSDDMAAIWGRGDGGGDWGLGAWGWGQDRGSGSERESDKPTITL